MDGWLKAALDYIPLWIDFQKQHLGQPGCVVAVARHGEVVLEQAFGLANLASGEALTPRHRFRVASHSKTFTAVGILKLRESGLLRLDDVAGKFVEGLHPEAAAATIQQLLSHSAGLVRDGGDGGYFQDRRAYLSAEELIGQLAVAPPLPAAQRFKYSNHGYGLLGLVISAITGEDYNAWIMREVVTAAGLTETAPDIASMSGTLASGHSTRLPLQRRAVIPGDNATRALASATGFVSTAGDLVRFFSQLSPGSASTLLSPLNRRDMTRRHWRDTEAVIEQYYGLGTMSGTLKGWDWFGHGGAFQGTLSRTVVLSGEELTISVLTNAIDGPAQVWVDGIAHILSAFRTEGAPSDAAADWSGRWWSLWGTMDFVPMGDKVAVHLPALNPPLGQITEITVTGRDAGTITRASAYSSPGEPVRRIRGPNGEATAIWLGGTQLVDEKALAQEISERYALSPPAQ